MGKLIIYTGPMKCGKTEKLLQKYNEAVSAHRKAMIFKPAVDYRYGVENVRSRTGLSVKGTVIDSTKDLIQYMYLFDEFYIDEFQLLGGNIDSILQLLDNNKTLYISGLNLTSEREPFGLMGFAMQYADEIEILSGNCEMCNTKPSKYTAYRFIKDNTIVIGDDAYMALCPKCYLEFKARK